MALLAIFFASTNCAKFPVNGGSQNAHLIFTMTVAGHIRDGTQSGEPTPYFYIVAVYPSTDLFPIVTGPEPVIAAPWGNGFVAGGATHFVQYLLGQPYPFTVYKFQTPDLLQYGATGTPVSTSAGTTTLQFEVDLSQFDTTGGHPETLQSVLVNFLTMDKKPQGNDATTKFWDALGDSRSVSTINDWVRIPLTSSHVYSSTDPGFQDLEPQGDTPDPNLDIVAWSVEVRKP